MTMDVPTAEMLDVMLRGRGIVAPTELLEEIAPAVRDMWELGAQLERDLAALSGGES